MNNDNGSLHSKDLIASIEALSLDQLKSLNELVVGRIRHLKEVENTFALARFGVDDYVSFTDRHEQKQFGQIEKINRKTIHVRGNDGNLWKVSPALLKKEVTPLAESSHPYNRPGFMRESDWVYGIVEVAVNIADAPPGYVPEQIVCMDGNGLIRSSELVSYYEREQDIVKTFIMAVEQPMVGESREPQTLRIEDPKIGTLLGPLYPNIEFVFGLTPEIYEAVESLSNANVNVNANANILPEEIGSPYSNRDIDLSVVAEFFDAAKLWYEVEKQSGFESAISCIGITVEEFQITDQVLFFSEGFSDSCGFTNFENLHDLEVWCCVMSDLVERIDAEYLEKLPSSSNMTYVEESFTAEELLAEISENGWKLANNNACPVISLMENVYSVNEPATKDIQYFEILCRALCELMKEGELLTQSYKTGTPLLQSYTVAYSGGKTEVTFSLPVLPTGKTVDSLNLAEKMALLDRLDGESFVDEQVQLSAEMVKHYSVSKEYKGLKFKLDTHLLLIELSVELLGTSVASLQPVNLEEILFNLVARKLVVPDGLQADLFQEIRAFFIYLGREYDLFSAAACLNYLDSRVKDRFLKQLTTTSIGRGDIESDFLSGDFSDLPGDWDMPPVTPTKSLSASQKKDRKNKRKQRKNSRKKNRR